MILPMAMANLGHLREKFRLVWAYNDESPHFLCIKHTCLYESVHGNV